MQPEVVARDLPARAEPIGEMRRIEARADHLAQRLLYCIGLRLEAREGKVGRKCSCEARHTAGDVQGRRARSGVGVARRQHQNGSDTHGQAHLSGIEPTHARACCGSGQHHGLTVLVRQGARREGEPQARRDLVA